MKFFLERKKAFKNGHDEDEATERRPLGRNGHAMKRCGLGVTARGNHAAVRLYKCLLTGCEFTFSRLNRRLFKELDCLRNNIG